MINAFPCDFIFQFARNETIFQQIFFILARQIKFKFLHQEKADSYELWYKLTS